MKKRILLGFLILLIPVVAYSQEKVEAPVWNVGDKWVIGGSTTVSVVDAGKSSYTVKYGTSKEESTLIYDKSSLNRFYSVSKGERIEYSGRNRRLFNFPIEVGKSWQDEYTIGTGSESQEYEETFTALGWEDVEVRAGKVKALKLEYKQTRADIKGKEGKVWYWYSPDVKYMVKCQYDTSGYWPASSDWEITSFDLKK